MSNKRNNRINQPPYIDRLIYQRSTRQKIEPAELLEWIRNNYNQHTVCNNLGIVSRYAVPDYTIHAVSLRRYHYNDHGLGYQLTLWLPYAVQDLELFKWGIDFFEYRINHQEATLAHRNDFFDLFQNHDLMQRFSQQHLHDVWEKDFQSFLTHYMQTNDEGFSVSNGVLEFTFRQAFLRTLGLLSLHQDLIQVVSRYMWQKKWVDVNTEYFFITVTDGAFVYKECAFSAVVWNNKQRLHLTLNDYLLIYNQQKWLTVRSKVWSPFLIQYTEPYDEGNNHFVVPILDSHIFQQLLQQMTSRATTLQMVEETTDTKIIWKGYIPKKKPGK